MTLFEAFKASVFLNIKNGLYLMTATLGIVILTIITSIINNYIDLTYLNIMLNSLVGVYSLYVFTWIITFNTTEKQ